MTGHLTAYILIPIISALIGWITNYVAVKMIFHPRRPVRFLGLKIQGLVPRRQSGLAAKIGQTVESKLLTHDDIQGALRSPEVVAEIETVIEDQVDIFIRDKLGSNPMIAMFLQGGMARNVRGMLVDQMKAAIPDITDRIFERAQPMLDLKSIVQRKIEEFDIATLESIIYSIANRELRMIVILGGVLGFVVGLGQVLILWFLLPAMRS